MINESVKDIIYINNSRIGHIVKEVLLEDNHIIINVTQYIKINKYILLDLNQTLNTLYQRYNISSISIRQDKDVIIYHKY